MILDALESSRRYEAAHPLFEAAFSFLHSPRARSLEPGRHELRGDRLVAIASFDDGRSESRARLEAHDRFIDIQYLLEGDERIGWSPRAALAEPDAPYDGERDVVFFPGAPASWIALRPGMFAVFFPEDAHAPMVSSGRVRKVVIKVAV